MELKVVSNKDKTLILETVEETVTLSNALRGELWADENVSEAATIKEHPYLENPKILVKTTRGKPETALDKAADRLIKQSEEFADKFQKAKSEL